MLVPSEGFLVHFFEVCKGKMLFNTSRNGAHINTCLKVDVILHISCVNLVRICICTRIRIYIYNILYASMYIYIY